MHASKYEDLQIPNIIMVLFCQFFQIIVLIIVVLLTLIVLIQFGEIQVA